MKSKRVLITGMAGLLGSYFSRYLLEKGYNVIGIDDFSGGYVENLPEGVVCSNIDLTDFNAVKIFFVKHKPEYVYHFAAYAAEGLSPFIRTFNYQANVIASANLITASINNDVNKFIFTSSNGVYGEDNVPPFKETLEPKPIDPYGIAKYIAVFMTGFGGMCVIFQSMSFSNGKITTIHFMISRTIFAVLSLVFYIILL